MSERQGLSRKASRGHVHVALILSFTNRREIDVIRQISARLLTLLTRSDTARPEPWRPQPCSQKPPRNRRCWRARRSLEIRSVVGSPHTGPGEKQPLVSGEAVDWRGTRLALEALLVSLVGDHQASQVRD